jgi:phenylacetic acid degradation operon negative regulatory protein
MTTLAEETTSTPKSPSEALVSLLHDQDRLRLWSLLATIIGDVVETIGGEITMGDIIYICGLMDIEPQAARTAMARLSKEGWVDNKSEGESIIYRFSSKGSSVYKATSGDTYSPPKQNTDDWHAGILPAWPQEEKDKLIEDLTAAHPIIMNNQLALWQKGKEDQISESTLAVMTRFDTLPLEWPKSLWGKVAPPPQVKLVNHLADIAEGATDNLDLDAEDALVIRVLLIHFWRRLALWHPPVVSPFNEELWPLPRLQRTLANAYQGLAEKSSTILPGTINIDKVSARFKT